MCAPAWIAPKMRSESSSQPKELQPGEEEAASDRRDDLRRVGIGAVLHPGHEGDGAAAEDPEDGRLQCERSQREVLASAHSAWCATEGMPARSAT